MSTGKSVIFLNCEIRSPPFSTAARREAGFNLDLLQRGLSLSMPISRPMPSIGPGVHELRVRDEDVTWRIIYRVDPKEVLIANVFAKKTPVTPKTVIRVCQKRFAEYEVDNGS